MLESLISEIFCSRIYVKPFWDQQTSLERSEVETKVTAERPFILYNSTGSQNATSRQSAFIEAASWSLLLM